MVISEDMAFLEYFGVSVTELAREYLRDTPELSGAEQARVLEIHLKANQAVLTVSPGCAQRFGHSKIVCKFCGGFCYFTL